MIEVKHTPGPWEVECVMCDEVNGEAYEVHADGGAISIAAPPSEADAYLIAAAPDLLAACQAAEAWFGRDRDQEDAATLNIVRVAIAEAIYGK